MTEHKKIIGIMGGMGPKSGVTLHSIVYAETRKIFNTKRDSDYPDVIHMALPSGIPDRTDFLLGLTEENPADAVFPIVGMLSDLGKFLEKPVVACVACNTFHAHPIWDDFISKVQKFSNVEMLNLIDITVESIQGEVSPPSKVAVLSTLGAYQEMVYESRLAAAGYDIFELTPQQKQDVHKSIYDANFGLKAFSKLSNESSRLLEDVVLSLKENNVERIILGCTELGMAYHDTLDESFVHPLKIAAKKLVHLSFGTIMK